MKKLTSLLAVGFASLGIQSASAALISLYEFNGSTADTYRGAGATGTVYGNTVYEPGVTGQAFRFDGSTYLTAPLAGAGLNQLTFSAWVKFNSWTDWASILKNWGSTKRGAYHIGLQGTSAQWGTKISNEIGTTGGSPQPWVLSNDLSLNTWYHVAITYGPNSQTQKLYINGVNAGVTPESGVATGTFNNNFALMSMGGKLNDAQDGIGGPPGWLDGWLDDVGFIDEELSAAQVASLYNAGLSGIGLSASYGSAAVPEPGQVAASLLLLAGIGGYVFLKRRKAAKSVAPVAA
jgi:hypothetical protein